MVTAHKFPIAGCGKSLEKGEVIAYKQVPTAWRDSDHCWVIRERLSTSDHISAQYPSCGSGSSWKVICQECSVAAGLEW